MSQEAVRLFANRIRIETLKMLRDLGFGHIGGSMSVTDLLAVLYSGVLKVDPQNPSWEDRDYLIVSKGHAGPAVYAALALKGFFPMDWLSTVNQGGTRLPSHCDRNKTPGIDMSTGSLGQGFSAALGFAHGLKLQGRPNTVYTILGDGECDEGQVWEGALYAPQHQLDNLIAFVDKNARQLDGLTEEVMALGDLRAKFEHFGWHAQQADGHDHAAIAEAIAQAQAQRGRPAMIILDTVKGKGCSFAEGLAANHHMSFTTQQCDEAIALLEKEVC